MGSVIHLAEWRERREHDPMSRLDRAIARLDGLLRRSGSGRLAGRVESELLAITGAVSAYPRANRPTFSGVPSRANTTVIPH